MLMEQYARANFSSQADFEQNFSLTIPENFNFTFDCVDRLAQTQPDKIAMVWCNDKGQQATYTFAQMAQYSAAAARYFAGLGIGRGDAVMLILKRRAQFWFALLALIKLGAIAIPATHQLTHKDIVYRNNAASIKAIVTTDDEDLLQVVDLAMADSPEMLHRIKLGGAGRPGWQSLDEGMNAHMQGPALPRVSENADIMMVYFTSGTTGLPKMVAHNYLYPLGHIVTARYWQGLHPASLHLTVADTGWAKAGWGKIFGQWLCEAAVFVYDHECFDVNRLLEVVSKYKVTSFCAPPTIYRYVVRANLAQYDLSALESATTAGEPLNADVARRFKEITGADIREGYGQTETTPIVFTSIYMKNRHGFLGFASPAYDVRLLDARGREVAAGETGEITVCAAAGQIPGVFIGYYRDAALTHAAWGSSQYRTGDLAVKDRDGYIEFVGRADDVIKSSSYRIGPFEVESVLIEHPAVIECAVTGVPDAKRGQAVKASIILAPGYAPTAALKAEIQQFVKDNAAHYKCPRIVEFVTVLPKTVSGKIRRKEIRENDAV